MIIYHYTTEQPLWDTHGRSHVGNGLGSFFSKIFSRVGKSTVGHALKNAARSGVQVAKKAALNYAKQAVPVAKELLKESLTNVAEKGAEKINQTIGNLVQEGIKAGAPVGIAHSLQKAAEGGVQDVLKSTNRKITSKVDEIASRAIGASSTKTPVKKKTRKRASKPSNANPIPRKKSRKKANNIQNLIEEL